MSDASSTLGPRVTVRCAECGASRNIQDAAGRGRVGETARLAAAVQPHLQRFVPCGKPLKLMVLGASNLWFGVTASRPAPAAGPRASMTSLTANWQILGVQPDPGVAQAIIDGDGFAARALRAPLPIGEVWACIEKIRAAGGPAAEPDRRGPARRGVAVCCPGPTTDRQGRRLPCHAHARPGRLRPAAGPGRPGLPGLREVRRPSRLHPGWPPPSAGDLPASTAGTPHPRLHRLGPRRGAARRGHLPGTERERRRPLGHPGGRSSSPGRALEGRLPAVVLQPGAQPPAPGSRSPGSPSSTLSAIC